MSKRVRIGVFIPHGAQKLDTACVDVLGVMSTEFLSMLPGSGTADVAATAPSVSVSYISTLAQGRGIPLTSGMTLRATHDYGDAAVAPGQLDIVVVPGPDPAVDFDAGALAWLRRQAETPGVDACGPRGLQAALRARFPKVRLVGDRRRWVQDGNLWSSGGVTNGNDLMAAYARASKHWPPMVAELGLQVTDVCDRGQFYAPNKSCEQLLERGDEDVVERALRVELPPIPL